VVVVVMVVLMVVVVVMVMMVMMVVVVVVVVVVVGMPHYRLGSYSLLWGCVYGGPCQWGGSGRRRVGGLQAALQGRGGEVK
jgi:hypothetical protein